MILLQVATALPAQAFAYTPPAIVSRRALPAPHGAKETALRISFPSTGRTVDALLWQPAHVMRRHGAVLFAHWLGDPAKSNPAEFAPDAVALAQKGITSLSVQEPWSDAAWFEKLRAPATDYYMSIGIVKDLGAALDVLAAQPQVDAGNIAFVGHDFGAMFGAVMSGIDPRPQYYVFIAGTATLREWYALDERKPADLDAYAQAMSRLDSGLYLTQAAAQGYLFQFARKDGYIPLDRAFAFFNGAREPRTMAIYDATHAMQSKSILADRLAWLLQRLH